MTRSVLRTGLLLSVVVAAGASEAIAADGTEVRTFAVAVDGKPAGTYRMSVRVGGDGTETVTTTAAVKARVAILTYTYELQSVEVWKGDKLVSVDATANDNGKRKAVKVADAGDGRTVTAGGKVRRSAGDVLTSTGWRGPGPLDKARDAVVLDTEDGSETAARVDPLPAATVLVGGATVEARRVRLTGKNLDSVWWFDAAGRPVRQEMKWDGHRVVLELTGVTR